MMHQQTKDALQMGQTWHCTMATSRHPSSQKRSHLDLLDGSSLDLGRNG